MSMDRRRFLTRSAAAISLGGVAASASARDQKPSAEPAKSHKSSSHRGNRIAVSTYSFWQFRNEHLRSIETCIDLAAEIVAAKPEERYLEAGTAKGTVFHLCFSLRLIPLVIATRRLGIALLDWHRSCRSEAKAKNP